ncbi:MAG: HD domain-containing protein [Clostridiales bacterium]|nr:HD domain-containing protein [Clostridiales bacterium]
MDDGERLMTLLRSADWGADAPLVTRFLKSPYAVCCADALNRLNRDALYESSLHGVGHIVRTICHGAMGAMEEGCTEADTSLLLDACAYHDVGRINDREDTEHGRRSARRLGELTGRTGEDLAEICAAVDVHARDDALLPQMLERYQVQDRARGTLLAKLLKDADGLDRVRIWDLNPRYLRFPHSKTRVDFAKALYCQWQASTDGVLVPEFVRKWKALDEYGNPVQAASEKK